MNFAGKNNQAGEVGKDARAHFENVRAQEAEQRTAMSAAVEEFASQSE